MQEVPVWYKIAAAVVAVYGLISLVGGVLGFRAGSVVSLVAGGVAGVLLLLCAAGVFYTPFWSFVGAIVLALLLLGRFAPAVIRGLSSSEEFLGTTRGNVALLMAVGGLAVIIVAAVALAARSGPTTPPP